MKRLNVLLHLAPQTAVPVGQLAEDGPRLYFQYNQDFLARDLWLSPYTLPPTPDLVQHEDRAFGPLFGLFDDSLPDGWGLLLMDRFLRKRGFEIESLSALDRLAFLGPNTMGALTYEPALDLQRGDTAPFNLHRLARQSQSILSGTTDEVLPQLMNAGGSPGGARPKVLVGISGDQMVSGETDLPDSFEHWIVKFPAENDFPDAGPLEYAYALMAQAASIPMTETRLFDTPEGGRFFGTKRFDRQTNQRFHVHTFGNLIHSNFRIPSQDYDHFLKVTINLTRNHQDLVAAFRQMVFNVLANNRDDHVKNFAFIMDPGGEWSLSPAYDLVFAPGPGGEHSMTVLGEGRSPAKPDIYKIGEKHGVKKKSIAEVIDQVAEAVNNFQTYAQTAGVKRKTIKKIKTRIDKNLSGFA